MVQKREFDLPRVDVFRPRPDHHFLAVDQKEEAVLALRGEAAHPWDHRGTPIFDRDRARDGDTTQSASASRHQCEQAFEQRRRGWRAARYSQVHRDHGGDAAGASIAPRVQAPVKRAGAGGDDPFGAGIAS